MSTPTRGADAVAGPVGRNRDGSPAGRRGPDGRRALAAVGPGEMTPSGATADVHDAELGGRQLSVGEIQQALRELRARAPGQLPTPGNGSTAAPAGKVGSTVRAGWVVVLAAHAGAGASTVALAVSDAAAAADRRVHLVETAPPARSGLVTAASAELGSDPTGRWRRGTRGRVTIDRRAAESAPGGWPTPPAGAAAGLTVLDLGLPAAAEMAPVATDGVRVVVVCRASVPGVRAVEQLLDRLGGPAIVAAVGPRRWPGPVTAGLGPRLRAVRAAGRVVAVPVDGRLEVTGPTGSLLPRPVLAAGRGLLALLDADRRSADPPPSTSLPSTSVTKGTGR